jgi:hypothetical protein
MAGRESAAWRSCGRRRALRGRGESAPRDEEEEDVATGGVTWMSMSCRDRTREWIEIGRKW